MVRLWYFILLQKENVYCKHSTFDCTCILFNYFKGMQLPLNKSTLACWKNNFRQISYMLHVHVKMKGLQNCMKYYLYVLRVTFMYLPVVFTCTWCINLCYLPVFICCIYLLCVLVVSTCCIDMLYLPVEPIFVSTGTFCNYKKCTCCMPVVSTCCIYLLYISSSSPPQPKNLLGYPFTVSICSLVIADTPPNMVVYGSLKQVSW